MTSGRQSKKQRQDDALPQRHSVSSPPVIHTSSHIITERHSGPLPHPSILEAYNRISPEIPLIIVRMAEKRQEHNLAQESNEARVMEETVIPAQIKHANRGQYRSFAIIIFALTVSVPIAIWGNGYTSAFIGAGGFIPWLITIFHQSNQKQPADNKQ